MTISWRETDASSKSTATTFDVDTNLNRLDPDSAPTASSIECLQWSQEMSGTDRLIWVIGCLGFDRHRAGDGGGVLKGLEQLVDYLRGATFGDGVADARLQVVLEKDTVDPLQ